MQLGQVSVESVKASKSWRPRRKTSSNKLKQTQQLVLRTICPTDRLLAAKDADTIRSTTGRLSPPGMLNVTIALKQGYFAKC